jgi:acyl dehydratase
VLDPERLLQLRLPEQLCRYGERDTMLYALGIGFGSDPMDVEELRFVHEDGLMAAPTQVTVLGWDRSWIGATGIDWRQVVHGEQRIEIGRPLQPTGEVIVRSRVSEVLDKGSGALFRVESRVLGADEGAWIATSTTSFFVRGAGGFSRAPSVGAARPTWPDRAPDAVHAVPTFPNQALLYRLTGDRNPHHALPDAARAGGFPRPLLHGMCTFGFAGRSVLRAFCGYQPARLGALEARFLAPVFPGEALRFELWHDDGQVSLRGSTDRDVVIAGTARLVAEGQTLPITKVKTDYLNVPTV